MDSSRIDELLERYWSCETSLEDEQLLKEYFQSGAVADKHQEVAPLFRYFGESKKKSLNDSSFDGRVMKNIQPKQGKTIRLFYNAMRIAAGVSVLCVAIWFMRTELRSSTPQEVVDTHTDPQLAFEETKKALMIISRSFGKAEEEAKKINLFNEAKEGIQNKETEIKTEL
jgi:hypothetical protein